MSETTIELDLSSKSINTHQKTKQSNVANSNIKYFADILTTYSGAYNWTEYIVGSTTKLCELSNVDYIDYILIAKISNNQVEKLSSDYQIALTLGNSEAFNHIISSNAVYDEANYYKLDINFLSTNKFFKYHYHQLKITNTSTDLFDASISLLYNIKVFGCKFKSNLPNYENSPIIFNHNEKYCSDHIIVKAMCGMVGIEHKTQPKLKNISDFDKLSNYVNELFKNNLIKSEVIELFGNNFESVIIDNSNDVSNQLTGTFGLCILMSALKLNLISESYKPNNWLICTNAYEQIHVSNMELINSVSKIKAKYPLTKSADMFRHLKILNTFPINFEANIELISDGCVCWSKNTNIQSDIIFDKYFNLLKSQEPYLIITTDRIYMNYLTSLHIKLGSVYTNTHIRHQLPIN